MRQDDRKRRNELFGLGSETLLSSPSLRSHFFLHHHKAAYGDLSPRLYSHVDKLCKTKITQVITRGRQGELEDGIKSTNSGPRSDSAVVTCLS